MVEFVKSGFLEGQRGWGRRKVVAETAGKETGVRL